MVDSPSASVFRLVALNKYTFRYPRAGGEGLRSWSDLALFRAEDGGDKILKYHLTLFLFRAYTCALYGTIPYICSVREVRSPVGPCTSTFSAGRIYDGAGALTRSTSSRK